MSRKEPSPSDLADKFMLRLPDGMRERIKASALRNNRSMNAEIVSCLEEKCLGVVRRETVINKIHTHKNFAGY